MEKANADANRQNSRVFTALLGMPKGAPETQGEVFLNMQPQNAADTLCNKASNHGIWCFGGEKNRYDRGNPVDDRPDNILSGLYLPFARMTYILTSRFHGILHTLKLGGRIHADETDFNDAIFKQWQKDLVRYSRFGLKYDAKLEAAVPTL